MAFHSTRAVIAPMVSNVCADCPGSGTLCARVPTGIADG
jgi:hypothetical protein